MGSAFAVAAAGAQAYGFCDNEPTSPTGAPCQQTRVTYRNPSTDVIDPNAIEADYSDYDMSVREVVSSSKLGFTLDLDHLGLKPAASAQEVTVFELGIRQQTSGAADSFSSANADRVLAGNLVRYPDNRLALHLVWLDAAADWSSTDGTPPPPIVEENLLAIATTAHQLRIELLPQRNWQVLGVTAEVFDWNAQSKARIVADYAMSSDLQSAQNLPLRLRSGVIHGNLQGPGMTTFYTFDPPFH